jgi:hypothetical protein
MNYLKLSTNIGKHTIYNVRLLLSLIPRKGDLLNLFGSIDVIDIKGESFSLSIQGSGFHYCEPTSLDFHKSYGKPSMLGFTKILDDYSDDVIGYVPVNYLQD